MLAAGGIPGAPDNGGGHKSTLELETGEFTNAGFVADAEITVGEEFHVNGCGFVATADNGQGGGSHASWAGDHLFTYDVGTDGCIVQGGSSTYTAPDKPGWYSITFFAWDSTAPFEPIDEGVFWFKVSK